MANERTSIEWTDRTWNPVTGCTKVSPGCAHCYAERITERFSGKGSFEKITLHPERLQQPLRWRKPSRIFVNSMSDLFHEKVPDAFIVRVFAEMLYAGALRGHTFQILTKRAARMQGMLAGKHFMDAVFNEALASWPWPLPFVWLGVSVENQHFADERIPLLLETPAAVRFISAEPLLGPVSLRWANSTDLGTPHPRHLKPVADAYSRVATDQYDGLRGLDWVICGGESGPHAREMKIEWARSLRDQCKQACVPFFFKQLGNNATLDGVQWPVRGKGGDFDDIPCDLCVREFPSKERKSERKSER